MITNFLRVREIFRGGKMPCYTGQVVPQGFQDHEKEFYAWYKNQIQISLSLSSYEMYYTNLQYLKHFLLNIKYTCLWGYK